MPIYLWSDQDFLCSERVVYVHYVASDDLLITTPLKKRYDLWSCSGRAGASLLGQDVVASLLSLCMAKLLRKWRRGWLYVRSNTKNAKSLLSEPTVQQWQRYTNNDKTEISHQSSYSRSQPTTIYTIMNSALKFWVYLFLQTLFTKWSS